MYSQNQFAAVFINICEDVKKLCTGDVAVICLTKAAIFVGLWRHGLVTT